MLLYWEMIKYAINEQYQYFDFGRSTEDEGTFKFKSQWGAIPHPMFWYSYPKTTEEQNSQESFKKKAFIFFWQRLPLWFTIFAGPKIRRLIHL